MKLTDEKLAAVRAAKTPEEIIAIADKLGVTVTGSDAELIFNKLNKETELSDEELAAIEAGGGCGGGSSLPTSCVKGHDNMAYQYYKCKGCAYERYQDYYIETYTGRKEGTHFWCLLDPNQSPIRKDAFRYGPICIRD